MHSPYRDYFLQSAHGPVFTHTNCQQGHTSPGATDNHCVGYFWNMANASARDYFIENLVQPLATAPMIDGIFYDAFNYGKRCVILHQSWIPDWYDAVEEHGSSDFVRARQAMTFPR